MFPAVYFCMRLNQLSEHFSTLIEVSPKHKFWTHQPASSAVEKRWPLILFLTYGNKKKSFGAKWGLYGGWLIKSMFWVLKNAVVWADMWELAFVIRFRRLVLLISWKTTDKQMVVYHSELTIHQWFLEQQLILDDLHDIRLGANYDLGWIHHTIDKHWSLMELHLK